MKSKILRNAVPRVVKFENFLTLDIGSPSLIASETGLDPITAYIRRVLRIKTAEEGKPQTTDEVKLSL